MAHVLFLAIREFAERASERRIEEDGIIAEAAGAARRGEDLTRALAARYETLHEPDGTNRILREWESHSSYARDRRVRVALAGVTFEGITRGLDADGALRIETDEGATRSVRAGDVTAVRAEDGRDE